MKTKQCVQCNQPYDAKRATSQYCSAKCRKLAFHGTVSVPDPVPVSVPGLSVPPVSVPKDLSVPVSVPQWQLKPGDDGYQGVCIQVDGDWVVRSEPEPTGIKHILKSSDLGTFRGSRPYYLNQDTGLSDLSCEQLHRRLNDVAQWQGSAAYSERVYRLVHGLTAHSIPANMVPA